METPKNGIANKDAGIKPIKVLKIAVNVNAAIISGKVRGFDKELPIPPMVIFAILTILAYYTALS